MHQDELLTRVRDLFAKALETRFDAVSHSARVRSQGYADGYMRALLDAGITDQHALLKVIGSVRQEHAKGQQDVPAVDAA